MLIWPENRIEAQGANGNLLPPGGLLAKKRGSSLGNSVMTVRLWAVVFSGGVALIAIFRGGTCIDKGLKATLQACVYQLNGTLEIGPDHLLQVGLPGIGAVSGQMKNPLRANRLDYCLELIAA